jgi:hypothetical protein
MLALTRRTARAPTNSLPPVVGPIIPLLSVETVIEGLTTPEVWQSFNELEQQELRLYATSLLDQLHVAPEHADTAIAGMRQKVDNLQEKSNIRQIAEGLQREDETEFINRAGQATPEQLRESSRYLVPLNLQPYLDAIQTTELMEINGEFYNNITDPNENTLDILLHYHQQAAHLIQAALNQQRPHPQPAIQIPDITVPSVLTVQRLIDDFTRTESGERRAISSDAQRYFELSIAPFLRAIQQNAGTIPALINQHRLSVRAWLTNQARIQRAATKPPPKK